MTLNDRAALKQKAQSVLDHANGDPKKLILVQAGVVTGVAFLLALINYLLQLRMDSLGGLAGLDSRGMLSGIQTLLQTASTLLLPIWEIGYLHACIAMAQGQPVGTQTLLEGFRRFGPVIRFMLLQMIFFSVLSSMLVYPAAMIFTMTPFADGLMEAVAPLVGSTSVLAGVTPIMDDATAQAITSAALPMLLIFGVLLAAVLIPILYRLRLTDYLLMDAPGTGALAAITGSNHLMKRNCFAMFKLDLSFWWYYLAQGLLMVLAYVDVILGIFGISLPLSPTVSFFLFYALSLGGQLLLFVSCKNKVFGTYTQAYLLLKQPPQEQDIIPAMPPQI